MPTGRLGGEFRIKRHPAANPQIGGRAVERRPTPPWRGKSWNRGPTADIGHGPRMESGPRFCSQARPSQNKEGGSSDVSSVLPSVQQDFAGLYRQQRGVGTSMSLSIARVEDRLWACPSVPGSASSLRGFGEEVHSDDPGQTRPDQTRGNKHTGWNWHLCHRDTDDTLSPRLPQSNLGKQACGIFWSGKHPVTTYCQGGKGEGGDGACCRQVCKHCR